MQFFPLQVYPGTKATNGLFKLDIREQDFRSWITPSGMHNMTINKNDKGLTYKQCVDFVIMQEGNFT